MDPQTHGTGVVNGPIESKDAGMYTIALITLTSYFPLNPRLLSVYNAYMSARSIGERRDDDMRFNSRIIQLSHSTGILVIYL